MGRGLRDTVESSGATLDGLMEAIVDRYFRVDCAIFAPNRSRLDHARQMAADFHADGVIHYSLQFCQPYQIEGATVERELEKGGMPVLRVDTDYGTGDTEQLRTRVEAFLEQIAG